jgi:hypothetical protein
MITNDNLKRRKLKNIKLKSKFKLKKTEPLLQRIWAIGLLESWFCIWDDLLRLFVIARVANPKNGLNLVPNSL